MDKDYRTFVIESGFFSPLDIHFARFIIRLAGQSMEELFLAAALVSRYRAEGHICLDLERAETSPMFSKADELGFFSLPDPGAWRMKIESTRVVGKPGRYAPLILDDRSRLYLYRYWEYQEELARLLKHRINGPDTPVDTALLHKGIQRLFSVSKENEQDPRKEAAVTAATRRFCVISGGPGTGKTTTVAKIIALILEQAGRETLRIALAAPTGKAASRLEEAIKSVKQILNCPGAVKEKIPDRASTIHRLLGTIPDSPRFRHNAQFPLPVDMVVVDEASMVDLALMSKLVQALPDRARLILLGDKDQLASVEAGSVLADICEAGQRHEGVEAPSGAAFAPNEPSARALPGEEGKSAAGYGIVQLDKSYRFGGQSGIGAVSRAVNTGRGDLALNHLRGCRFGDVRWNPLPGPEQLPVGIRDRILTGFEEYLQASEPRNAFKRFERFRILCALKEGPYGVRALNRIAEQILERAGLIDPARTWYRGRPVLITRNDYQVGLFNGNVGIALPDPRVGGELRVFFAAPDGTFRKIHPLRLPAHETVYAMTVHRSQGSEFDRLILLLPDRDYPVLSRELIYTGITRAKKRLEVWGLDGVFCSAVARRTKRASGFRDALLRQAIPAGADLRARHGPCL